MKSLWAQYSEELRGTQFIGKRLRIYFVVYTKSAFYLEDIYVIPSRRKEGLALSLVEEAEEYGRKAGKPFSMAVIQLANNGHVESLKAHLAAGFTPFMVEHGKIWLKRSIKEK